MNGLERLTATVKEYNPDANIDLIRKAYAYAKVAHAGQTRLSGEPFISHPSAVAQILANYKLDSVSIAVALLHDVVEDTPVRYGEITNNFGKEIADLVEGVTKVTSLKFQSSSEEDFVENVRKMILAMSKDLRVILVKLADRLHNMQTANFLPPERQIKMAKSTLDIYAPLAERLGMGEMKGNLEDLAFPYLFPEEYKWLVEYSRPYYRRAEEFLEKATRVMYKALAEEGIRSQISARPKHFYSLWKKLSRSEIGKDINKIYDLVAMRILVETVKECYATLGIVHSLWKPLPAKGISDFIAQSKPNGYRSLHTTVFSLHERVLEIQIRTFQMHEEAEHGIAAHWYYSSQKNKLGMTYAKVEVGFITPVEKLSWVKQLVAWQNEVVDSQEFMDALKFDALAHRIFVFSPKGDVYDLPFGATPVDFAYAVHSRLGNQTAGAKVNGKMASLDYRLKSGEVVEIVKKSGQKPTKDWLQFVVTRIAKREINRYFREKIKEL